MEGEKVKGRGRKEGRGREGEERDGEERRKGTWKRKRDGEENGWGRKLLQRGKETGKGRKEGNKILRCFRGKKMTTNSEFNRFVIDL